MRISKVTEEELQFSDGSYIVYDHCPECCEYNYADFSEIGPDILSAHFSTVDIRVADWGFLLCLDRQKIWIPCRSRQNGYYARDLDVFYYDKYGDLIKEINIEAELD